MVELDDEMLLDSPMKQSPATRSPTGEGIMPVMPVATGDFLDELNYNETQLNPDGFFNDANDQVSFWPI